MDIRKKRPGHPSRPLTEDELKRGQAKADRDRHYDLRANEQERAFKQAQLRSKFGSNRNYKGRHRADRKQKG